MIAQFDTKTDRLVTKGQHNGNPRMWVVQVRADELPHILTFRPTQKVQIADLGELIGEYLKNEGVPTGRVRWTATAR